MKMNDGAFPGQVRQDGFQRRFRRAVPDALCGGRQDIGLFPDRLEIQAMNRNARMRQLRADRAGGADIADPDARVGQIAGAGDGHLGRAAIDITGIADDDDMHECIAKNFA